LVFAGGSRKVSYSAWVQDGVQFIEPEVSRRTKTYGLMVEAEMRPRSSARPALAEAKAKARSRAARSREVEVAVGRRGFMGSPCRGPF